MARILVTGSSDGLGAIAARSLIKAGHEVVLHARNSSRASDTQRACPGAKNVLIADLSSIREAKRLAIEANKLGPFDAVIHNAGIGYKEPYRKTQDGIAHVFAINSLAPYILTCLITPRPKRLMYISSVLHNNGDASLKDVTWEARGEQGWSGYQAYSDSKFHDVLLAFAVYRRWPEVMTNVIEPGWVPTKMGGPGAPDDLELAAETQVWLAAGTDGAESITGKYLYHGKEKDCVKQTQDEKKQEEFLRICSDISGVEFPK